MGHPPPLAFGSQRVVVAVNMSYNYNNYSNGTALDGDGPEDNLKVTVREVRAPSAIGPFN